MKDNNSAIVVAGPRDNRKVINSIKASQRQWDLFLSSLIKFCKANSTAWVLVANRFSLICPSIHLINSLSIDRLVLIFDEVILNTTKYYHRVFITR